MEGNIIKNHPDAKRAYNNKQQYLYYLDLGEIPKEEDELNRLHGYITTFYIPFLIDNVTISVKSDLDSLSKVIQKTKYLNLLKRSVDDELTQDDINRSQLKSMLEVRVKEFKELENEVFKALNQSGVYEGKEEYNKNLIKKNMIGAIDKVGKDNNLM